MVSAHDDGALGAFEAEVRDYLLKPVRFERLKKAIERLDPPVSDEGPLDRIAVRRSFPAEVDVGAVARDELREPTVVHHFSSLPPLRERTEVLDGQRLLGRTVRRLEHAAVVVGPAAGHRLTAYAVAERLVAVVLEGEFGAVVDLRDAARGQEHRERHAYGCGIAAHLRAVARHVVIVEEGDEVVGVVVEVVLRQLDV